MPLNKPVTPKDQNIRLQIWVTRALVLIIILMSLLWGLTIEMYKKDLDRTLMRLKKLEKQITIQRKP